MKWALAGLLSLSLATGAQAGVDDTIYDIQSGVIPLDDPVSVQGVIVTNTIFIGFYAQEPDMQAGSYANGGVFVYGGSGGLYPQVGDVVDITGVHTEFFFDTEIDITAGGDGYTIVGTAPVPDPSVLNITDLNNGGSGPEPPGGWANGEEWEGVLVRVEMPDMVSTAPLGAGCASTSPTRWGVYQTSAPSESLFVRNSVATHEIPLPVNPITFLQGTMTYHQCHRKVIPRDNADIGYTGPPNIVWAYSKPPNLAGGNTTVVAVQFSRDVELTSAETLVNYFFLSGLTIMAAERDAGDPSIVNLTTMTQPDAVQDEVFAQNITTEGGATMPAAQSFQFYTGLTTIEEIQFVADPATADASPLLNGVVSTIGVAITSTNDTGTGDFSIQDPSGFGPAEFRGLRVGVGGTGVDYGDRVRVSGSVLEIFGRTSIDFAGFGLYEVQTTVAEVEPLLLSTPEDLPYNSPAGSERYEDMLVTIAETTVDSVMGAVQFGEWWLLPSVLGAAPGDSAKADYIAGGVENSFNWEPCPGNTVRITGVVEYSFGQYKVIPRRGGDISHLGFGPGCLVATGEVTAPIVAGTRNYPNPFNPTTTIEFTTPSDGAVTLEIYDTIGRRVTTLVQSETYVAGTHGVRWDGTNDAGEAVASGSYFYRIQLETGSVTDRMTLLK